MAKRRWVIDVLKTTLLAAAFSVTMETGQYLLAWRESSLLDVISDMVGAAAGWGIPATLHRLRQPHETASAHIEGNSVRRAA